MSSIVRYPVDKFVCWHIQALTKLVLEKYVVCPFCFAYSVAYCIGKATERITGYMPVSQSLNAFGFSCSTRQQSINRPINRGEVFVNGKCRKAVKLVGTIPDGYSMPRPPAMTVHLLAGTMTVDNNPVHPPHTTSFTAHVMLIRLK